MNIVLVTRKSFSTQKITKLLNYTHDIKHKLLCPLQAKAEQRL